MIDELKGNKLVAFIPGKPVAQNLRVTRTGKVFRPKEYRVWVNDIRTVAKLECKHEPINGAVRLTAVFFIRSKNKGLKVTRPDVDNYMKAAMDALEGIFYHNDSQVTTLHAEKRFSNTTEGVVLEAEEIE